MGHRYQTALVACSLILVCLMATALGMSASNRTVQVAGAASASATPALPPNSLTVTGSGEVDVPPDMATVSFGVLETRQNANDAQTAANQVMNAAVKNLRALHIPDRLIQTENIALAPNYDNNGNVTGYNASQTLAVTADTLSLVGKIVDAGVSAGANNNVSITYGLQNENAARIAALKLAVSTARARAEAAAATLGRSLVGAHVQLSESSAAIPQPVANEGIAMAPRAAASAPATQAFGGTLTIHEDVTLTYTFP